MSSFFSAQTNAYLLLDGFKKVSYIPVSGLRRNVFPQFAEPTSRMLQFFPRSNSSSVRMASAKTNALILLLRRISFAIWARGFGGILRHSLSGWMKIFFPSGSAIDGLEGLVPLLISMSWRLALDKHTLACLQWKSSGRPDHHQRVHLQGLRAMFHSVFPGF